MSTRQIRGNLPPFVIKSLKRDRTGIYSGVVLKHHWLPEDLSVDLDWLNPTYAPDPFKIPAVDSSALVDKGLCIVTFNYEGGLSTSTFREEDVVYELDTTMAQDPIETNPNFEKLKTMFSWDKTERRFAEYLAQAQNDNTNTPYPGDAQTAQTKNKLFGTDSWLAIGATLRKTYGAFTVPSSIFKGIGTIVTTPTGTGSFNIPAVGKGRNWLYMAPRVTQRGNVVEIVLEWMLSGPNGWIKEIYNFAQ